jgi:2-oxoglutarate ferredoxin oxidoreductase subunit alpha
VPKAADLPRIDPRIATKPNTADGDFMPYARDEKGARPWAVPGTPGLMHRIGGLEKEDLSGDISYDPDNHQRMTDLRAAKVAGVDVPDLEVDDPSGDAELLVLGWGSTFGPIGGAVRRVRLRGGSVATAHLRHISPLPGNTEEVLRRYPRVLVPETNTGQLVRILRAEYLLDLESLTKVKGLPFSTEQLEHAIEERIR